MTSSSASRATPTLDLKLNVLFGSPGSVTSLPSVAVLSITKNQKADARSHSAVTGG